LIPREIAVAEDLSEEPATDGFSPVNRNHGASAIGVLKKVMASLGANDLKPELP